MQRVCQKWGGNGKEEKRKSGTGGMGKLFKTVKCKGASC